jgi:hypothetical protein
MRRLMIWTLTLFAATIATGCCVAPQHALYTPFGAVGVAPMYGPGMANSCGCTPY